MTRAQNLRRIKLALVRLAFASLRGMTAIVDRSHESAAIAKLNKP
jgi:hypothetical protein